MIRINNNENILKNSFLFSLLSLFIPLILDVGYSDFRWNYFDYIVFFTLIITANLIIRAMLLINIKRKTKLTYALLIAFVLLLLWIELAVGILDSILSGN